MGVLLVTASLLATGTGALTGLVRSRNEIVPASAARSAGPAPAADEKASEHQPLTRPPTRQVLEQALETAAEIKDPAQKARILVLVARAQAAAGDRESAQQNLQRAFELGNALPNDNVNDFNTRHVLAELSQAQADLGDVDGALKTLDAYGKPKLIEDLDSQAVDETIAEARVQVACAQARAGKYKEAAETVRAIDKVERLQDLKWPVMVEIAAAQAKSRDWKQALETAKTTKPIEQQIAALVAIARLQAQAGMAQEARARIAEALKIVPGDRPDDEFVQHSRAKCLQVIALAQADVGDMKSAFTTAAKIPEIERVANVVLPPFKQITLGTLRARAGDYEGAKAATWDSGVLRRIVRDQAEAKDINGAVETAGKIDFPFEKALAYVEIAQVQARAGDRKGAAKTFAQVLEFEGAVPEVPFRTWLLRALASAQTEAGQGKAAQAWIAKLQSPNAKAWALVGLAEGIAKQQATNTRPRQPTEPKRR
jgi:tetratricopeptide (TPR) repeat protein